jgi:hypothetical protein
MMSSAMTRHLLTLPVIPASPDPLRPGSARPATARLSGNPYARRVRFYHPHKQNTPPGRGVLLLVLLPAVTRATAERDRHLAA